MRTLIRGGWVVGFDKGTHTLIRNGIVVIEDDRIVHVGVEFEGHVEREIDARGKIVSPGFIDTHVHAGHRATHRLLADSGRRDVFGQPFLDITVPREGTRVGGDVRYGAPGEGDEGEDEFFALFTVVELLRNGITTFMEVGSQIAVQEDLMRQIEKFGIRGYLGPGYDSGRWVGGEHGRLKRVLDEPRGWREFGAANDFIRRVDDSCSGRIRGLLSPRETDTCSFALLQATRTAAGELKVPICIHAAYSIREFYGIVFELGITPIELLDKAGLLGPDVMILHGNFVAENRLMNYSAGRDLELLARSGTWVSHAPVNIVRRGRYLDSWERYRRAGVNLCLGTDTYPRDMILQMRMASYFGKVVSGNLFSAPAGEVFEAATLGGATALGREDLGRLAPGAKADVIIIDVSGRDNLRYAAVRDPVQSLVDCGVADDVETVIVDGVVRMEKGRIPGVDMGAINRKAQIVAERIWSRLQEWDPLGRTAEEMCPSSFPPFAVT